jgi:hypothetical protein
MLVGAPWSCWPELRKKSEGSENIRQNAAALDLKRRAEPADFDVSDTQDRVFFAAHSVNRCIRRCGRKATFRAKDGMSSSLHLALDFAWASNPSPIARAFNTLHTFQSRSLVLALRMQQPE